MKQVILILCLFSLSCNNDDEQICTDLSTSIVGDWNVKDLNTDMDAGSVLFLNDGTGIASMDGAFSSHSFGINTTNFEWSATNFVENQLQITFIIPTTTGPLELLRFYNSQGTRCDQIILFQISLTGGTTTNQADRFILTPS